MHWLLRTSPRKTYNSIVRTVLPNIGNIGMSRIRTCRCCGGTSLILQFSPGEELSACIRCRANLRYEMLAEYIRAHFDLPSLDVVELDRSSPLARMLSRARSYRRTYYDPQGVPGAVAGDGAEMQDVTALTFPDASVDLIVSSEVLEHVSDLDAAFREMARVLRPGGSHVFTVPTQPVTRRLARVDDRGEVVQIVEPPEYHGDNNSNTGILAFWHLGPDFTEHIDVGPFEVSVVGGPEGVDRRIVWKATRR